MSKKYCVIVLGMHRSGTSALTRQIMDAGFELISETLPPHETDNPFGYWESREMLIMNQRFNREIQSDWRDVNPLPPDFHTSEVAASYRMEFDELIKAAFTHHNQIVIKAPDCADYCHCGFQYYSNAVII